MEAIILIPMVLSILLLLMRSPKAAFLYVYLPSLLLLPQSFIMRVPGFPDISFSQAAIIPIFIVVLPKFLSRFKLSITDFFVFGIFLWGGVSDVVTTHFSAGRGGFGYRSVCCYSSLRNWQDSN